MKKAVACAKLYIRLVHLKRKLPRVANSQLSSFIERIKADDVLREKILDVEKSASRDALKLRREIEGMAEATMVAVNRIAEEAGYDITGAISRSEEIKVTPTDQEKENLRCWLTCCLLATSEWTTEPLSLTGFGGDP